MAHCYFNKHCTKQTKVSHVLLNNKLLIFWFFSTPHLSSILAFCNFFYTLSRFIIIQGRAELVFLRYLQRWGKDYLRRRLDWTLDEMMGNPANPRHITSALCPCQYVEELLANKPPRTDVRDCCPFWSRFLARRGVD